MADSERRRPEHRCHALWSAVVNGALAAPLIVLVVLLTSDHTVMGNRVNPPLLRWLGWSTAVTMTAATAGMFVTL